MRSLTLAILLLAPNLAFAQTQLAWKFREGDVFRYERIAKDAQATIIKGQPLKQDVKAMFIYRCEVTKRTPEAATIKVTIEQASVQNVAGTTAVENKILEKSKGAVLTANVSSRGEVTNLAGYDALIEQMSDKREAIAKVVRQTLPEAAVRQELQQVFLLLPKDAVAAGSRWQHEGPLVTPPLGRFLATLNAVHKDLDRAGNHKLEGTLLGKYERPDQPADAFRVVGGELTIEKGIWNCAFDSDAGRVVNQSLMLEMKGTLTVETAAATTPVEVLIRREVATRLLPRGKE
jgi:hypothetical protein